MEYTVIFHNDTPRVLTAVALGALGAWGVWRLAQRPLRSLFLALGVVLGGALCIPMVFGRWSVGPCGWVTGFPLLSKRTLTACIDVIDSTGAHLPLALVDAGLAFGLGFGISAAARQLSERAPRAPAVEQRVEADKARGG
jgi:hypothetical protein